MPSRPSGQLPEPSLKDLADLAVRKAFEGLLYGKLALSVPDAVAVARLAWQVERDQAIPERDKALAQAEMFQRGMGTALWTARKHFERIDPARWRSFMDDFRRESEKFAGPDPRR